MLTFSQYVQKYHNKTHPAPLGGIKSWTEAEIAAAEPGVTAEQVRSWRNFILSQPVPISRPNGILTNDELIILWNAGHPEDAALVPVPAKPTLESLKQAVKLIEEYIAANA